MRTSLHLPSSLPPIGYPSHGGPSRSASVPCKAQRATRHELLDPRFPYGEDLLQFIWGSGLYDAKGLSTTDGRVVEVIRPGRIQRNSGPDLHDALLRIDGQLWAGNVEVHVRSSEWNAHGHQHDPAYNNVVLHVVYAYDSDVRTANGHVPPTLQLMDRVRQESIGRHQDLMRSRSWVPCASSIDRVDRGRIGPWLDRVLVDRLERKTAVVEALYRSLGNDPLETFHHLLLRGFGAQVNNEAFAMLAHALPWRTVMKYRDDPFRVEALLFGQAGLLNGDAVDAHPRQLQEDYRALARLHGLVPAPTAAWKFGRLRPANFPTVRLGQLARLISAAEDGFSDLLEHDTTEPLLQALMVEAGDYWTTHYVFDRLSPARPKRLGRAAAGGLIINTVVPYLFAMGRVRGRQVLVDRALRLLEDLPPERNSITEGWAALGVENPSAARSQALLELKNSLCGQRRCLFCVIGTELLKAPTP